MSSINEDTSDIRVLADKAQKRLSAVVVETAKRLSAVINNVITPSDSDDLFASESVTDDQDFLKRTKGCPSWSKVAAVTGVATTVIGGGILASHYRDESTDQTVDQTVVHNHSTSGEGQEQGDDTSTNQTEIDQGPHRFVGQHLVDHQYTSNITQSVDENTVLGNNPSTRSLLEDAFIGNIHIDDSSFGPIDRNGFLQYVKNEKQIATQCPDKLMEFVERCNVNANPDCKEKVGTLDVDKDSCFNHIDADSPGVSSWIAVNLNESQGTRSRFITMREKLYRDDDGVEDLWFSVFGDNMSFSIEKYKDCPSPTGFCGKKIVRHFLPFSSRLPICRTQSPQIYFSSR